MSRHESVEVHLYRLGIEHFNRGEFFAAHEVLEDVWRASTDPDRLFLQGLVQAAVALHHHSTGNLTGARSVLRRSLRNLDGYPKVYLELRLEEFREGLRECGKALDDGGVFPSSPRMKLQSGEE
jgi:uncharacterized protein